MIIKRFNCDIMDFIFLRTFEIFLTFGAAYVLTVNGISLIVGHTFDYAIAQRGFLAIYIFINAFSATARSGIRAIAYAVVYTFINSARCFGSKATTKHTH